MKPTWIVENFSKEPSFKGLTDAIKELEYPIIEINGDYSKNSIKGVGVPIINGSIKMCRVIHEDLGLKFDFSPYKCSSYYSHFGPYLFNDKYCLMSLKELERQKWDIWGRYGKECQIFVRPDSGEKEFQAGLLDIQDINSFLAMNYDHEHELVLISTPKNINWEGRVVVQKGGIIAHSTYRYQGLSTYIPSIPEGALRLSLELNKIEYYPNKVFCYDICEDMDGNFWLLELTSFFSAGLYECDKKTIVKVVSDLFSEIP